MIHLREIAFRRDQPAPDRFPFNVLIVRTLDTLSFTHPVSFFVGENGSGKSTLLETLACAARLPTVGSQDSDRDPTLTALRKLARYLKWVWTNRTRRGFFMRAEDFIGYAKQLERTPYELAADIADIDRKYEGRSQTARDLAKMAPRGQLAALQQSYCDGLDAGSYRENFFVLFRSRFVPNGLYLLDEPEAAISSSRQLAFLTLLHQTVRRDAQLIIVTHSPIILAYPGAVIFSFEGGQVVQRPYDELEHVTLTRAFLAHPETFLAHLLSDAEYD